MATLSEAAGRLSQLRRGALIVVDLGSDLRPEDFLNPGISIDGQLSVELLLNLFASETPLHDGAVLVKGNRILAAGVILPFSRLQETEADRLGLTYMARAGYDPRAARDLWVRMAEASAKMGRSTPEWMSTHPSNASRIRDIEAMLPEALASYKPR